MVGKSLDSRWAFPPKANDGPSIGCGFPEYWGLNYVGFKHPFRLGFKCECPHSP